MSKKISEVFDVEPVPNSTSMTPVVSTDEQGVIDDSELVRRNMREMIEIGNRAVTNAFDVAEQSESPRAYEVLSTLLKTMADINGQLLDAHEKERKILRKPDAPTEQKVTNNMAFIGTTNELNQLIMDKLNKS